MYKLSENQDAVKTFSLFNVKAQLYKDILLYRGGKSMCNIYLKIWSMKTFILSTCPRQKCPIFLGRH